MAALLWIMTILFVVLAVVDPHKLWYATTAWQFKHPEANEPSEASFALGRVVSVVAAAGFGVAALTVTAGSVGPLSQERLDSLGRDAARELSGAFYKYGTPGVSRIEDALDRDDVEVREGPSSQEDAGFGETYGIEETYELVGTEDDSVRGCLTVSYDGGLFADDQVMVDTSYDSGAC